MKQIKIGFVFFCLAFVVLATSALAVNVEKNAIIGDSIQTKQYLLQISKRKIESSDFKISKEQFLDRYSYSKETDRLIHHYFKGRKPIDIRRVFNGKYSDNNIFENIFYFFFNFSRFSCGVDGVLLLFSFLFFAVAIAAIAAIYLLILTSILIINLVKLFVFSRRKLLLSLIDTAINE